MGCYTIQSSGLHFFNEGHKIYRIIADINKIRKEHIALRRGRQYLRQISDSGDEGTFGYPHMIGDLILSVVPWSRIFSNHEMVLAVNTDVNQSRTAWVTIDNGLHVDNSKFLKCLYSTDPAQIGSEIKIEARNGKAVRLTVPVGGFVIYH